MASCIRNIRAKTLNLDHFFKNYDDKNLVCFFYRPQCIMHVPELVLCAFSKTNFV